MRIAIFLGMFTMAFGVSAKENSWLGHLIEERTKPITHQSLGFFSTHSLVFFYGSQCSHCQQFAPILKRWTKQHNVAVLPLSLDNQPLPQFPRFLPASTQWINAAFGANPIQYPAIFIVNPKTKALYAVGFGMMHEAQLHARMHALIPKIKAYEKHGEKG